MNEQPGQSESDIREELTSFPSICDVCKEKNLTTSIYLASCRTCSTDYCTHFASSVDPQYCSNCCHDVQMTEQTITKTQETYSEEKDKVFSKTFKARQIKFSGLDWLFFARKQKDMTDTELLLAIEYHQSMYHSLMYEREKRRVEHFHRNAGRKIVFPSTSTQEITTTTTIKKSRKISTEKQTKTQANVAAVLTELLKQGMSPADIMKAMGFK